MYSLTWSALFIQHTKIIKINKKKARNVPSNSIKLKEILVFVIIDDKLFLITVSGIKVIKLKINSGMKKISGINIVNPTSWKRLTVMVKDGIILTKINKLIIISNKSDDTGNADKTLSTII